MRGQFATLALPRKFLALGGNDGKAGVEAAARLIEEIKHVDDQSSLFLFFKDMYTWKIEFRHPWSH